MKRKSFQICLFILLTSVLGAAQDKRQEALNLNNQGVVQISERKYEAALGSFQEALRLEPNYPIAYYNLSEAFFQLKQFENALLTVQKAIKLYPTYAEAYHQLGLIYLETGHNEKAVEALKKAVRLKSNSPVAFYNLGCAYIRLKKFKEAVEPLEKAKQLDENNLEIRVNLGFAYGQLKKFSEAIAEMQKAVEINANDDQSQLLLCNFYLLANDKPQALSQYARVKLSNENLAQQLHRLIYHDKVVTVSGKQNKL